MRWKCDETAMTPRQDRNKNMRPFMLRQCELKPSYSCTAPVPALSSSTSSSSPTRTRTITRTAAEVAAVAVVAAVVKGI